MNPTSMLNAKHYEQLHVASGISREVIDARGAYTETDPKKLMELGFADYQALAPALVFPIHGLNGWEPTYSIKSDRPRAEVKSDGRVKPIKYEYPAGSPNRLDCPPTVRDKVLNPAVPLAFTEGLKKADAGASRGMAIVGLQGVWNFLGKSDGGYTTLIPDFGYIPLKGRRVAIIFDSDVASNVSVGMARDRLRHALLALGARVQYVDLPPAPDGGKQGLDDYLLTHTAEDVWALALEPEDDKDREIARLRAELQEARQLQSATARALANPDARKLAVTAVRLASELAQVKEKETPTEEGDYRISHSRLRDVRVDDYGAPFPGHKPVCSEGTVRNHLEQMEKIVPGLRISKRPGTVTVRFKDRNTGERIERDIRSELTYVNWDGKPSELLDALANHRSEEPERRGGRRCPGCHSPKITQLWRCEDCGSLFKQPDCVEPGANFEAVVDTPPEVATTAPGAKFEGEGREGESTLSTLPLASMFEGGAVASGEEHLASLLAARLGDNRRAPGRSESLSVAPCAEASLCGASCVAPDYCPRLGHCAFTDALRPGGSG